MTFPSKLVPSRNSTLAAVAADDNVASTVTSAGATNTAPLVGVLIERLRVGAVTDRVAAALVADPAALLTTTVKSPASLVDTPVNVSVALVAPAILTPFFNH